MATASNCRWVNVLTSCPFGEYCRSNPFVFSFEPRYHGLRALQK